MTTPRLVRVADYIANTLVDHGITDMFMVTGGGAMHLNDAFGRHPGLRYVCCHHEQACSIAAQGYYRLTNRLAAVNVTTGPGGTNAITGVYGAWVDSLGMVVVSGQVKWETLARSTGLPLRQLGDQEVDITRIVDPITKYAVMVTDPTTVRYHLEKAIYLARTGRPGPVWLDVPINVQSAMVDAARLEGFDAMSEGLGPDGGAPADVDRLLGLLREAKRPVIYAGAGIRLAGVADEFLAVAERLGIPVATGFNAHDLIPSDHKLFAGRPGTIGDRAGNFAVQNSDVLFVLGCRLNIRQVSYAWQHFARAAYKIVVDVDAAELAKPTVTPDLAIHADVGDIIRQIAARDLPEPSADLRAWVDWCAERRRRYPVVLDDYWTGTSGVNPYCFADALFDELGPNDVVVTGDGTACITTFQAAKLRRGQRLFSDSGSAPMGFDLPAAIGACVGTGGKRVVCVTGDGSIMLNLQELQTIHGYDLPIKIFVLNNEGYHSIRQTQRNFFPGNDVGSGPESGVTFPSFERVAYGFDIPFFRCCDHDALPTTICAALMSDGPAICEIQLDLAQPFAPKVSSKRLPDGRMVTAPLEDMAPFLPRDELLDNMLVPVVESDP